MKCSGFLFVITFTVYSTVSWYFCTFCHTSLHSTQTSARFPFRTPSSSAGLIKRTWLRDSVTVQSIVAELLLHSQWLDWSDLTLIIHMHRARGRERVSFTARLINANLSKALQLMVLHWESVGGGGRRGIWRGVLLCLCVHFKWAFTEKGEVNTRGVFLCGTPLLGLFWGGGIWKLCLSVLQEL